MKLKSILLMARRRERLATQPKTRGDAFPVFSPREWADLPVHHPRAEA
jgi:hypothetical protein